MIWHIFKKDFRLLWPFVLIFALVYAAKAWVFMTLGLFNQPESLRVFADFLPILLLAGMVALIAAAFFQDTLFSSTQDWRIRPLRRRDLLLAKLLFILLAVQGPVFVIDLGEGLADGLSFTATFINALGDGFFKFCLLSLPVAMLASMTDRPASLLAAAIVVSFGLLLSIPIVVGFGNVNAPLFTSGVAWLPFMLWALTAIVTACIILPLQYFKRATVASYLIFVAVMAVVGATWYLPWEAGFAVQRLFAAQPDLSAPITMDFAPEQARTPRRPTYPVPKVSESNNPVYVDLPLSVTGITADTRLFSDHLSVRLIDGNGQIIASSALKDSADTFIFVYLNQTPPPSVPVFAGNGQLFASPDDPIRFNLHLVIPPRLYLAYKQQAVRLEIDFSLTLMQKHSTVTMPALEKGIHKEQGFACATRVIEANDTVMLSCLTASKVPSCSSATLIHPTNGGANPDQQWFPMCTPNYAPLGFTLKRELIGHVIQSANFSGGHGRSGLLIKADMLPNSQIVLQNYEAQDHFTRQLVIPEFRLGDWGPAE